MHDGLGLSVARGQWALLEVTDRPPCCLCLSPALCLGPPLFCTVWYLLCPRSSAPGWATQPTRGEETGAPPSSQEPPSWPLVRKGGFLWSFCHLRPWHSAVSRLGWLLGQHWEQRQKEPEIPAPCSPGRAVSSQRTQAAWADFPLRRLAGELLATVLPSPRPVALLQGPARLSSGNHAFFPLAALRTFCLCWGFCSVTVTGLPVGFFSFLLPEALCWSSGCSLNSWPLRYGLCPFPHCSSETQVLSAHLSFRCRPLSPVFST